MSRVILCIGLMRRLFENFYEEDVGFRFRAAVMLCAGQKTFLANPSSFPRNMSLGFRVNKKGPNNELLPRV
jgi:hypothetical protein